MLNAFQIRANEILALLRRAEAPPSPPAEHTLPC
jgi:hypothetical protein